MRGKLFVSLALILASITALAQVNVQEVVLIHKSVGQFKFEIPNVPPPPHTQCCGPAIDTEIIISLMDKGVVQRIPMTFTMGRSSLEYADLNGDGYTDLLVFNDPQGNGPLTHADIWLYEPSLGKFVLDKKLSGRGEIKKSHTKGCALVLYKEDTINYVQEEWCFDPKTKVWNLKSSTSEDVKQD